MKADKEYRVCFAASSGGHLEQLMQLRFLMEKYDSFLVTERTEYGSRFCVRCHYLVQANRHEKSFIIRMLANSVRSLAIFLKERPDAIVCTGALSTIPLCLICKLAHRKLIFIESFAKVSSPTMTGRLIHKFADRFYVQWKTMLAVYPDATYVGSIY